MTATSKDAKLVAIAVAMGFGTLVFTLFEVLAPEVGTVTVLTIAMLPTIVVAVADLFLFGDSASLGDAEEVPE